MLSEFLGVGFQQDKGVLERIIPLHVGTWVTIRLELNLTVTVRRPGFRRNVLRRERLTRFKGASNTASSIRGSCAYMCQVRLPAALREDHHHSVSTSYNTIVGYLERLLEALDLLPFTRLHSRKRVPMFKAIPL